MEKEEIKKFIRQELSSKSKSFFFMSGLPRAGSTLLSSILNQNPIIYSGPSSPVVGAMVTLETELATNELYLAYPKQKQAKEMISSLIYHYYSDVDEPVIIDKNRSWINRVNYIPGYFGIEPKILYPVRDIKEILASFIMLNRRNPYTGEGKISFIDEMLIKSNIPLNDSNRCRAIAGPGILGQSYEGLKKALFEGWEKYIHFIEYNDLINDPKSTIDKIYDFLNMEHYNHSFHNLKNYHQENDKDVYGLADMHQVREQVSKSNIISEEILPEDILGLLEGAEFWRNLNPIDFSKTPEDIPDNIFKERKQEQSTLIG